LLSRAYRPPERVEAAFRELRLYGVLRSWALYLSESFTNALRTGHRPRICFVWHIRKGAMALDEEVLTGMALYWWVVFVLWATRRDWK
jgi:hypothetical protein